MSASDFSLEIIFGDPVSDVVRRRIAYAAQTYAATWDVSWRPGSAAVRLCYGAPATNERDLALTATYLPLAERGDGSESPRWEEGFPHFHAGADWLGELFEWIGGEYEHASDATDSIGRVPFSGTLPGRFGLDPEMPWALLAMRGLNAAIVSATNGQWPSAPRNQTSMIVATHDLDYLPLTRFGNLVRGLKNVAVAQVMHNHPRLAVSIAMRTLRGFFGRSPLDRFDEVVERERSLGAESASYVIAAHHHRRDANYDALDPSVLSMLRRWSAAGMEIGIHGSYESILGPGSLTDEYARMRGAGFPVIGGRQHWIRFRGTKAFDALVAAGALYDTSVGFYDRAGFRTGASFAYVPYDFSKEAPYPLLEFPLAIMDGTLAADFGEDAAAARAVAQRIVARTLDGPGGASIVWHNTGFGGAQLQAHIGELYWWILQETGSRYVSGRTTLRTFWPRFAEAGLLPPKTFESGA